ncbi:MAG: hypothetical protein E6H66_18330, partial [Betaproteobacteria bacterium]
MRLEETIEFLRARFGASVDLDACARIHEITEGWPMAVQLAISLVESGPGTNLGAVSSRSQDIGRFFQETVLSRLSPQEADFVVGCSILDALHPDLCRVMTGSVHASALLDRLQRTTPILTAVEGDVWLRMHPLARSAFAPLFAALPEDRRQELHCHRPAFGDLVNACARIEIHAGAEARAQEFDRLFKAQVQILRCHDGEIASCSQFAGGRTQRLARSKHELQIRRSVVEQIWDQFIRGRVGQLVQVVEQQRHGVRQPDDLGEQLG